jgi:phosphotransferase system enzyme I (PtsP)
MAHPTPTRRLLARLRALMAAGTAQLSDIVSLVAGELVAEVCSAYGLRGGEILELRATHGLNPSAVGRTRLRVGEGIIGLVAATGQILNLADAQNHPAFAYRPETGEEPYASMLAVPVRRAGRTLGVLAVQNRASRRYTDDEVEVLETVAMLLTDMLATGADESLEKGFFGTVQRHFEAASLSPGIVLGHALLHGARRAPRHLLADQPEPELARLNTALTSMRKQLDALIRNQLPDGDAPRDVMDATRRVAADPGWLRRVTAAVRGGLTAEAAVHRVASDVRGQMRQITDPYLRERLADLEDLADRLLLALGGGDTATSDATGAILIARRLGPAQLLDWHARGIAGVCIEEGSAGGHAAILARALGLPAVGGARGAVEAATNGDDVVLDGEEGALILRPEAAIRDAYERAGQSRAIRVAARAKLRDAPSVTADGTAFRLLMNIGLPQEVPQLDTTGAEGIGLFRTEIAMMARGAVPDVAEQAAIYCRVLDDAGARTVVFRTLDLGSDKLLPDHVGPREENPAMGWRSLRVGLDRPAVLRRQLRALLLGATGRPVSIMFPMVATLGEFRQAKALLLAEAARIKPSPINVLVGTMLEVPALLWQVPALMAECDFVSIGSNDLLQFIFAADRGTPALAERYDLLSAPMLSLLEEVSREAAAIGKPLSLCGEAAARPLDAAVLLALGISQLSMSASSVLAVKESLRALDLTAFRPFLDGLRRSAAGYGSLREPIAAWARDHGLPDM